MQGQNQEQTPLQNQEQVQEGMQKQKNTKRLIILIIGVVLFLIIGYLVFNLYIKNNNKLPIEQTDNNNDDILNNQEEINPLIGREVENEWADRDNDSLTEGKELRSLLRQFECTSDESCEFTLDNNTTIKLVYGEFIEEGDIQTKVYINNNLILYPTAFYDKMNPAYFSIINGKDIIFLDDDEYGNSSGTYYIYDSSGKLLFDFSDFGIKNSIWKYITVLDGKYYFNSTNLTADMSWAHCFPAESEESLTEIDNRIVVSKDIYEFKDDKFILVENIYKKTLNDVIKEKYNMTCAQLRDLGEDEAFNVIRKIEEKEQSD